jgi:hypothetical protein
LSLTEPAKLVHVLNTFFNFKRPEYERWDLAAEEFKGRVPDLAQKLLTLIQAARLEDKEFEAAFKFHKPKLTDTIPSRYSIRIVALFF